MFASELRHGAAEQELLAQFVDAVRVELVRLPGVLQHHDTLLFEVAAAGQLDEAHLVFPEDG